MLPPSLSFFLEIENHFFKPSPAPFPSFPLFIFVFPDYFFIFIYLFWLYFPLNYSRIHSSPLSLLSSLSLPPLTRSIMSSCHVIVSCLSSSTLQTKYDWWWIIYMTDERMSLTKLNNMKELYDNVEITMNSISLDKFNKNYEDLSFEQTRIIHNIYFSQI